MLDEGYVEITHGGGASCIAQINDTDHHLFARQRFIDIQTDRLIRKAVVTASVSDAIHRRSDGALE